MTIAQRITAIEQSITNVARQAKRAPEDIELIAVSKGQDTEIIQQAYTAGLRQFAENYWQEAQAKLLTLHALPITWHFIGPIQSNKAAAIASHFAWVHSVDSLKIAQILSRNRAGKQAPLNICIQINLDEENSKRGIVIEQALPLTTAIQSLPNLALRGFMAIPKPCNDAEKQYQSFKRLADLLQHINQQLKIPLDTLSMGMSDDWPAAIRAGSTMIRIGRAIFGERL